MVEVAFESIYVSGPELAERSQPSIHLLKWFRLQSVGTALCVHRARSRGPARQRPDGRPHLATLRTMAESLASVASSSAVKYHADSMSWCGAPSSRVRFASRVKPNVMYFLSARKKQTVLPSFSYPGMPYHTVGWSAGALRKMSTWRRSPVAR